VPALAARGLDGSKRSPYTRRSQHYDAGNLTESMSNEPAVVTVEMSESNATPPSRPA
jgi:hypothetical protein